MNKTQVTTITILLATTLLVGGVVVWNNNQKTAQQNTAEQQMNSDVSRNKTTAVSSSDDSAVDQTYKAGEYAASGDYESPDGAQSITIRLTINADGTVTDTSATKGANGRESSEYQGKFISGYKSQVVGKDIDTLSLDSVSGSSLTPQGFNDALEKIKEEAKA